MMAIRMFEYDFAIALESRRRLGRKFYVEFPRSCVIYLRSTKNTPDVEEVELLLPDGQVCAYRVPTVKVERYTKDSIFEKNLLLLLPFYVMRYEESAHIIGEDSEKLRRLLKTCASHSRYFSDELDALFFEIGNKCLQILLAYGIIKTWIKICLISIIMSFHMVEDMCIPCSTIWYENTGRRF